jgi:hypothetical protein
VVINTFGGRSSWLEPGRRSYSGTMTVPDRDDRLGPAILGGGPRGDTAPESERAWIRRRASQCGPRPRPTPRCTTRRAPRTAPPTAEVGTRGTESARHAGARAAVQPGPRSTRSLGPFPVTSSPGVESAVPLAATVRRRSLSPPPPLAVLNDLNGRPPLTYGAAGTRARHVMPRLERLAPATIRCGSARIADEGAPACRIPTRPCDPVRRFVWTGRPRV